MREGIRHGGPPRGERTVQHRSTLIKQYFCTRGYSPGIFMSSGQIVSTQSSCLQIKEGEEIA